MSTAEVRLLALDDVEEGQILTQDLQASGGAVLLLKGTVLTPKLLEMLRSRGYTELWVESPQDQLSLDEIRARLDAAFQHSEPTWIRYC